MSRCVHRCLYLSTLFALSLSGVACGGTRNGDAPLRSPSHDYRPPPPTTAEGKGVGADGVAPGDRLEEGAQVGVQPVLAPGWNADEHGLHHDPKRRVGGSVDTKHEEEVPRPAP
jgi:hypothetical protein